MKLFKIIVLSIFTLLLSLNSNAQCFEIESILVDACGSPEGENEMVRFKIGNSDLCSNDLTAIWPSANPWLGIVQNANTANATTSLNATILSCGFLKEPTSCILPANATVILITSPDVDVTANSFANLLDTLYVIYQTAGNTNGHFKNYDSNPNLKTLTMSFSNPVGCTDQVTYDAHELLNINGLYGGNAATKNGATVNFTPTGTPTYINDGCRAPFELLTLDITATEVSSGTRFFCPGDDIEVDVAIQGPYQEIIWSGFNGTFAAQNVVSTIYTSTLADNIDFKIFVSVVTMCGAIIKDSVLFTVNQTPTVTNAGPFTTFGGTQTMTADMNGGTWSADCGACINSSTGVFDPSVSGEGTFQVCYDAGCGQDCISILVDDNCTMTWTIDSFNPLCYESNDGSVTINISGAVGTPSYLISDLMIGGIQLNPTLSSPTANGLTAGTYYFSVTDDLCTIETSIELFDPAEMEIQYTVVKPNCYGIADGLAFVDTVLHHSGNYNQLAFQWSQGVYGENPVLNDTLYNMGANDYYLSVTDLNDCNVLVSFSLTYPDSIYFSSLDFEPAICRNQIPLDNGQGQIYAAASGGSNGNGQGTNFSYLWTELETGSTTVNTTWGNKNPGSYTITATNDLGCTISKTITLDSLSPKAIFTLTSTDFTSSYEGTAVVDIELTNQSINYDFSDDLNVDSKFTWSFGFDNGNTYISSDINELITQDYLSEGVYEICLVVEESLNGCKDTACQTIIVHDIPSLQIPNVFTPNQDDVNDVFFFPSTGIIEFNAVVYNRWGNTVFEFNEITDVWDGKNYKNNSPCADGVYFYMFNGTSSNGKEYKGQGNVHLIRKE